jgi:hypothetical protein
MKVTHRLRFGFNFIATATTLIAVPAVIGAPANAQKPAAQIPISQIAVPQALFAMPAGPEDGKDPFYPRSQYPYAHPRVVSPTNVASPQIVHAELKLQGFSGPPDHPLAIINGKTFGLGEEAEVNTPAGKVPIRVLQFKLDAVVVQTPSERRELKLRAGI